MNRVVFIDGTTNMVIDSYPCDWKFEVGQTFHGFWGYDSTVVKVELGMSHESDGLMIVQRVWVKRVPLEILKQIIDEAKASSPIEGLRTNNLPTDYGVMHLVQDTDDSWMIMSDDCMNFGCVTMRDMQNFCTDRKFRDKFIENALTF